MKNYIIQINEKLKWSIGFDIGKDDKDYWLDKLQGFKSDEILITGIEKKHKIQKAKDE